MNEGAGMLFQALQNHVSLSALTIANHDRFHRNRIGLQACQDLCNLLHANKILSFLNISDNRIGNDGLATIAPSLNPSSSLVVLNLQNNDLEGVTVITSIFEYLRTTKNLLELNLSSNKIGDQAIIKLSETFEENTCHLQKLVLQNCKLTHIGTS